MPTFRRSEVYLHILLSTEVQNTNEAAVRTNFLVSEKIMPIQMLELVKALNNVADVGGGGIGALAVGAFVLKLWTWERGRRTEAGRLERGVAVVAVSPSGVGRALGRSRRRSYWRRRERQEGRKGEGSGASSMNMDMAELRYGGWR